MTDWIDDLTKDAKEKAETRQRKEEMQLHKAKIVEGALPRFWREFENRVVADCAKVKEQNPGNKELHCSIQSLQSGLRLTNDAYPLRKLTLRLNMEGQCIDVDEEAPEKPRYSGAGDTMIKIGVTDDDNLVFSYKDKEYIASADLSEALIEPFIRSAFKG
jgi:hypothetical protein